MSLAHWLTTCALALAAPAAQAAHTPLASYTFDDGTAADSAGSYDGMLFGAPQVVPGISGSGLRLDGLHDWVWVPSSSGLGSDTLTLSLWLHMDTAQPGLSLVRRMWRGDGYWLRTDNDGRVNFSLRSGWTLAIVTSEAALTPGRWTHVVASYDGSELRLYLDGLLVDAAPAPGLSFANDGPLLLGAGWRAIYAGVIDEVEISQGAAGPDEVCAQSLKVWDEASGTCLERFTDVTDALGVADREHGHFGMTMVDIDEDGWLDLYYVNGLGDPPGSENPPSGTCPSTVPALPDENRNVLYMNNGDGTFGPDVAPAVGLDDGWNAMRHVWGDYDRDGRLDVISHNFLVSPLYHALPGPDLLFEDASAASETNICLHRGTGASWVDLNDDGWLDLYAVEYDRFRLAVDHVAKLFMNDGDGTFTEVTAEAGLDLPDNPMGTAFGDFDNDGDQDLFNTNSHEAPSRLYRHDGLNGNGVPQFTDVAAEAGVAVVGEAGLGIGAAWGDFNNDRWLDLLFVRTTDSRLWRSDGPAPGGGWTFTDVTNGPGLDLVGHDYWGGNFVDLDNDGWLDIVTSNRSSQALNRVFMNNADGSWREVGQTLGLGLLGLDQLGVGAGDIDNDGDLDLSLISRSPGRPNVLMRNDSRGNNWIQFKLRGVTGNPEAVGARIEVLADLPGHGPTWQVREVTAGTGFFIDYPRVQTFGLGRATGVLKVRIMWPGNPTIQNLGESLSINQRHEIFEPTP